tara:strand:- start:34 stop:780 length:747 start_codon:yes stop_codon:yes gene_type:complete
MSSNNTEINKNNVVNTFSASKFITSDEFEKEGDDYTKKALMQLENDMQNANIKTNSSNYNLRNRKHKNKRNTSDTIVISDDNDIINGDNTDTESDDNLADNDDDNLLIQNATQVIKNQNNVSNLKRKRFSVLSNSGDSEQSISMAQLMMGQREKELQKCSQLLELNSELKTELSSIEVKYHYLQTNHISTKNELTGLQEKYLKLSINHEQFKKEYINTNMENIVLKYVNYFLIILTLYFYISSFQIFN